MAKIFISYRRVDSAAISGRIYDRLVTRFKRRNIFKDVDDIPAGVDFGEYIQRSVRECAVVVVVIGPNWLDARGSDGGRRLDDPHDWVRVEIETALSLGLIIIPLLVEEATIPTTADLPESLRELPRRNALRVRNDPDFAHDMERVVHAIERAIAAARPTPGIFRRSAASRLTPQPPTQPTQPTQPEQLDLMPTVAEMLPASNVAATKPALPKQLPASGALSKKRARRAVLAGVAIALVMTSIAMLFSHGIIPFGVGSGINQRVLLSFISYSWVAFFVWKSKAT